MLKILNEDEIPKRDRKSESKFEATEEWASLKSHIDKGLKPKKVAQISLTAEDMENIGLSNRRAIARFIQKYITENGLDYEVKSFHKNDMDHIVIQHKK